MAKMGRPKIENTKDKLLTVRIEPKMYEKLERYAVAHGTTVAFVVRGMIERLVGD